MISRQLFGFLMISIVLGVLRSGPLLGQETTWKAGTALAKITPEKFLWMSGYGGRKQPADGTLHDLWVKVLALEGADGSLGVLVTCDLLGIPKGIYESMCGKLKTQAGLDRSQVIFNSSHTHTGPVLRGALYDIYPLDDQQLALIEDYSAVLEDTIIATVLKALSERTPVTLWAGEGTATFAVNRRNNPQNKVTELREKGVPLKGPSDHSLPVLAVRTPEGGLAAVAFGYACHSTTLSFYKWSGDYGGFAQLAFQKSHPGVLGMFWAGCGADQNPLPRRTVELCQKYGQMLADGVEEVIGKPMRPIAPRLRTAFEFVDIDFGKQPTKADLEAELKKSGYQQRWGKRLLKQLEAGKTFPKSYPVPVQVWKLGDDQLWITVGGEVVVDYALKFKDRFGPTTWVAGYTNDVMCYIPSHRVWKEGGYEAGAFSVYGQPAYTWSEEIEERITASVDRLVEKLK